MKHASSRIGSDQKSGMIAIGACSHSGQSDLMEFEVVPVVPGATTAEALAGQLDTASE